MKIENQLCTLEQAKILKELGVKQLSYFGYFDDSVNKPLLVSKQTDKKILAAYNIACIGNYAAFTVAELGVMCRDCISGHCANTGNGLLSNRYYATPDEYADYDIDAALDLSEKKEANYVQSETQAQALAGLLIWLLLTNSITIKEVNQRLTDS